MTLLAATVPFADMARRKLAPKPKRHQINFRLEESLIDRMERFSDANPLRPTLTRIVEVAVAEWLDKHEPKPHRK